MFIHAGEEKAKTSRCVLFLFIFCLFFLQRKKFSNADLPEHMVYGLIQR